MILTPQKTQKCFLYKKGEHPFSVKQKQMSVQNRFASTHSYMKHVSADTYFFRVCEKKRGFLDSTHKLRCQTVYEIKTENIVMFDISDFLQKISESDFCARI